jgi:uncharacterized protein
MARIDTVDALREVYASPSGRVTAKQLDHLDKYCRIFLELSPFCVVASHGADGLADATPRGDAPGFAEALDDHTLAIPDRPGNRRVDTLSNILANPGVGLLFLVPGFDETLRVNGRAEIRDDADLRARFAVDGKLPATVLLVHVEEAYLHCGKAFMRSKLWDPASLNDRSKLPSIGQMIKEQISSTQPAETQDEMIEQYRKTLY